MNPRQAAAMAAALAATVALAFATGASARAQSAWAAIGEVEQARARAPIVVILAVEQREFPHPNVCLISGRILSVELREENGALPVPTRTTLAAGEQHSVHIPCARQPLPTRWRAIDIRAVEGVTRARLWYDGWDRALADYEPLPAE